MQENRIFSICNSHFAGATGILITHASYKNGKSRWKNRWKNKMEEYQSSVFWPEVLTLCYFRKKKQKPVVKRPYCLPVTLLCLQTRNSWENPHRRSYATEPCLSKKTPKPNHKNEILNRCSHAVQLLNVHVNLKQVAVTDHILAHTQIILVYLDSICTSKNVGDPMLNW